MRLAPVIALAIVAASFATAVTPADAQTRRGYRAGPDRSERITFIDENGRVRTRITVRARSYLDGGTEVVPGERKFTDYAFPPTYMNGSAYASWDPTQQYRAPLPLQGWLPGFNQYAPYF